MSNKDWQVGPVLKDKLNSQGTLFRGGTKYSSDRRFPRGYTPERLNEVRPAVGSDHNFRDFPFGVDHPIGKGTGEARRRVVDNLSRSTVPAAHLQGVQFNPGQATLDYGRRLQSPDVKTTGLYNEGAPHLRNLLTSGEAGPLEDNMLRNGPTIKPEDKASISIRSGYEDTPTTIHEVGHHVSKMQRTDHSQYQTGTQRGREEGFADNYSFEHFRDRRGESLTSLRQYPTPNYGDDTMRMNFTSAYHHTREHIPTWDDLRPPAPHVQQRLEAKDLESSGEGLFRTWDNGDGTVAFESNPHPDTPLLRATMGWTRKGRA